MFEGERHFYLCCVCFPFSPYNLYDFCFCAYARCMPRQRNRLYRGPRVLVGVRVPSSVHKQLSDAARENHMDVGPYASLLIERAVSDRHE